MTKDQGLDPRVLANVRARFDAQPFMVLLGAALADVGPGAAVVALDLTARHAQHGGVTHAGVMLSVAGTACACAALAQWPADASLVGVQLGIQLLAPAPLGRRLHARARVLKAGLRIAACQADLVVTGTPDEGDPDEGDPDEGDSAETLVAVVTGTLRAIRPS